MKGKRTIIGMSLGLIWAVLAQMGFDVPLAEQEAILAGIIALYGGVMRFLTTTPVGKAD